MACKEEEGAVAPVPTAADDDAVGRRNSAFAAGSDWRAMLKQHKPTAGGRMKKPDSCLERLLSVFYASGDHNVFLNEAGEILGIRLFFLYPGGAADPCLSASAASGPPYSAGPLGAALPGIDVLDGGIYACTILAEAAPCEETAKALETIASLIHLGIGLYGWFGETRSAHPDLFLERAPDFGKGVYCLYFPADMSLCEGAKNCEKLSCATGALHCFRERQGFALVLQRGEKERQALFQTLEKALSETGLKCGVAGPFASSSLARGGMEKAREAALYAKDRGGSPLRFVSDLRWSLFCAEAEKSVQKEGFEIGDFLQHALKRVLACDAENGTQYYDSMFQYLLCGKSMKLAAQRLGIHRNTLDYRIGRMGELFGIDFSDRHTCFELLFSCRLIEETGCRP